MKITGITPNLITDDMDRAVAFYRDVLGFTATQTVPDEAPYVFVMMARDGIDVFLNDAATVRKDLPDVSSLEVGKSGVALFVVVEDVEGFWAGIRERANVVMPLTKQWYGMTEFSVTDPDGHVITFAERHQT